MRTQPPNSTDKGLRDSPVERSTNQDQMTELNVYVDVYRVLLGGMLLSTALFIVGIVLALLRPQFVPLSPGWIRQHYHWQAIVSGVRSLDSTTVMLLATVLLILTPVARVAVSIYAFAVDGDRPYVIVTSIVLLMIAAAVVLGFLGLR